MSTRWERRTEVKRTRRKVRRPSFRLGSSRSAVRSRGKKKAAAENGMNDPDEKRRRLEELEKNFVGGEEANNEERTKRRKKKLLEMKEKQEQKRRMIKAIDNNDEDMMMRVFDNAQEEVRLPRSSDIPAMTNFFVLVAFSQPQVGTGTRGKQTFEK